MMRIIMCFFGRVLLRIYIWTSVDRRLASLPSALSFLVNKYMAKQQTSLSQ